jgi:hypothetical protein
MTRKNNIAWLTTLPLALFALLAPAIVNGFPFVFADTGGYLARPFEHSLALGRSALYGLFLATGISCEFWPQVILQAVLTIWIVGVVLRVYVCPGPIAFAAVISGLIMFSSLPWYAGMLMPDIFLPLAVVALHILAFAHASLRRFEPPLLIAVVAFAMASHMSILALTAALLLLFFALKSVGRRFAMHSPRLDLPIAACACGIVLALFSNLATAGKFGFTPGGSSFLFARLLQDGIVARYLADRCPDPDIRLCAFRAELPHGADDWLWGNSPLGRLGGWEAFAPEARWIIVDSVLRYPLLHARTAMRATAEQLVTLDTGEGFHSRDNWHAEGMLRRFAPRAMASFQSSLQQRDALDFKVLNLVHVPSALIASAALPFFVVLLRRRNSALAALALTVAFAILTNAAICGIFSNPNARYQSRIAPLAVLTVMAILAGRLAALDQTSRSAQRNACQASPPE